MITRHPCLSITPTLIDTILRWCIARPFKGYCQQMLGINIVLICHKPQGKHGKQASTKGLWTGQRENSKMHRSPALVPGYSPTWLWISTVSLRCGPYKIGVLSIRPWVPDQPQRALLLMDTGTGGQEATTRLLLQCATKIRKLLEFFGSKGSVNPRRDGRFP